MRGETPKCGWCKWTNVGLWNIGDPGKPKWICQGCGKRLIEATADLLDACKYAEKYLGPNDPSDGTECWNAIEKLRLAISKANKAKAGAK